MQRTSFWPALLLLCACVFARALADDLAENNDLIGPSGLMKHRKQLLCTKGTKCSMDAQCPSGCGQVCKKCPPNGCLAPRLGACLPPEVEISCAVPANCNRGLLSTSCKVTGCSGEICSSNDVTTDCQWKSVYSCYKGPITTCGAYGQNGGCAWKPTDELKACIANSG